ncbi:MAG TPA: flagellar biosynthetic protein FliR [Phycisphaerales bacterium]|nr:flagellar biosynthetic protein FliR [Phycisphaerales bacterium]
MTGIEPLLAHAVPFILVATRMLGLFVFAPILSSVSVPGHAKALLAFMLAAAVYPSIPAHFAGARADLFGLLPLLVSETLIGVCVGLIGAVPVMMLQLGGQVAGFQMGLSMASVYNPEFDTQSDVLGETLFYLGFAVFLSVGGLEAMYAALLGTFERVPLGGMAVASVPLESYVGLAGSGFEMALRVSAPASAIVFLIMVAMGFVMKTMPQINVMSVGFAVKIVAGILATALALQVIHNVAAEEAARVLDLLARWVDGLSARGG